MIVHPKFFEICDSVGHSSDEDCRVLKSIWQPYLGQESFAFALCDNRRLVLKHNRNNFVIRLALMP